MFELTSLLDAPDSTFWYEYAAGAARDIIDTDAQVMLQRLLLELPQLTANMQAHLAYILCNEPGTIEHEILTQLSKSDDENVAWRANEALNYYR
jgi:hypothetical protein